MKFSPDRVDMLTGVVIIQVLFVLPYCGDFMDVASLSCLRLP